MASIKSISSFLEDLQKRNGHFRSGEFEVIGEYRGDGLPIRCKCLIEGCGHEWEPKAGALLTGSGCPRFRKHPGWTSPRKLSHSAFLSKLSARNARYRNGEFEIIGAYEGSNVPIACKCLIEGCGHEWSSRPGNLLSRNASCPKRKQHNDAVFYNSKTTDRFLADMAHRGNPNVIVMGRYVKNAIRIDCKCKVCGHKWQALPSNLLKGRGCPRCAHMGTSKIEQFICTFLEQQFGTANVKNRDRSLIGMELDIVCMEHAWEPGAWRWHKSAKKKARDRERERRCHEKGIKLYTFYDECPEEKPDDIPQEVGWYPFSLWDEPNQETLRQLCIYYSGEMGKPLDYEEIDWAAIKAQAIERSALKTHEEFLSGLRKRNEHYRNGEFDVIGQYTTSSEKILCKCTIHGEWEPVASGLMSGHGCPKCVGFNKDTDSFLSELKERNSHYRNGEFEVLDLYDAAAKPVTCKCSICSYQWKVTPNNLLSKNRSCPRCSGSGFTYTHEEFLRALLEKNAHYRNGEFEVIGQYKKANSSIECRCAICGYSWKPRAAGLLYKNSACPKCANVTLKSHDKFVAELAECDPSIEPLSNYVNNHTKMLFRCKKCGYEWQAVPASILNQHTGCPRFRTHEDWVDPRQTQHATFLEKLAAVNPNVAILGEYSGGHKKIRAKCLICGCEWEPTPHSLLQGHGCPNYRKH